MSFWRLAILLALILSPLSAHGASLTASWNANQEADLAGYKLYYGTQSGSYGAPITIGKDATSYRLTGLAEATTYYAVMTAFDTSGNESGYSEEASASTLDATAPGIPGGVTLSIP